MSDMPKTLLICQLPQCSKPKDFARFISHDVLMNSKPQKNNIILIRIPMGKKNNKLIANTIEQ